MQTAYVNVDCANIYKEHNFRSAIDTQAVLWEELKVQTVDSQFSQVICEDGYKGWINNHQIYTASIDCETRTVTANHVNIFNEPDENALIIREATLGCNVPVLEELQDWLKVKLPDGQNGWIKKSAFRKIPGNPSEIVTKLAKRFLGVPYFWGGKTPKGLDCSGFIQLLFKLANIKIRRDSPMQFEDARHISENFLDGNPGDLLFFAENSDQITHVSLKLNQNEIIHARGMVRINDLDKNSEHFDEFLHKTFIAVKTFF